MIRKEIRRLLDTLFDGSAKPLVSHLVDMDDISIDDLKKLEAAGEGPGKEGGGGDE